MFESIINDICEMSFDFKNKLNDGAERLCFYVRDNQVIQLAQEVLSLKSEDINHSRLRDLVLAKDIPGIKAEFQDFLLLGVGLAFEDKEKIERINNKFFHSEPHRMVATHTYDRNKQWS